MRILQRCNFWGGARPYLNKSIWSNCPPSPYVSATTDGGEDVIDQDGRWPHILGQARPCHLRILRRRDYSVEPAVELATLNILTSSPTTGLLQVQCRLSVVAPAGVASSPRHVHGLIHVLSAQKFTILTQCKDDGTESTVRWSDCAIGCHGDCDNATLTVVQAKTTMSTCGLLCAGTGQWLRKLIHAVHNTSLVYEYLCIT